MRPKGEVTVQVLNATYRDDLASLLQALLETAPARLQTVGLYLVLTVLWATLMVVAATSGQF